MNHYLRTMKAAVLHRFGGPEQLRLQEIEVPAIGPEEVLIRVAYAGVGEWDTFEREGGYAAMLGMNPTFPYVLGSEGSGVMVAMGDKVSHLHMGDQVYAPGFLNPRGGFYAEYAAIDAKYVSRIPDGMLPQEAAVISGVGITALRGLDDVLQLRAGESVMIFGAGGGVGHLAVQLAKCMGARVFAVASGTDGVAMVKNFQCDAAVNGREDDIIAAARRFAPQGFDAALFTAGGESANAAAACIRAGGRIAYPNGIHNLEVPKGIKGTGYNGEPDPEIIGRLRRYIVENKLTAHISHTFELKDADKAHEQLENHYLGKICLRVSR